jgi:hypothetical protein
MTSLNGGERLRRFVRLDRLRAGRTRLFARSPFLGRLRRQQPGVRPAASREEEPGPFYRDATDEIHVLF